MEFSNRQEIIAALEAEFGENPRGFNNTEKSKSVEKFWTYNRLFHYYWDIKKGLKKSYLTQFNPLTGFHELKK